MRPMTGPPARCLGMVVALALLAAAACAPAKSGAPGDVYGRINQLRAQHGAGPLAVCGPLAGAAQAHANDMAANGVTGHTGSDGSTPPSRISAHGYNWSAWGEVIARDQPTVDAVLATWMGSPAHRDILLDGRYQHLGVGHAGGGWVADLGAGGAC